MKKYVLIFISTALFWVPGFSQDIAGRVNRINNLRQVESLDATQFHFVVMADRTGGHRDSVFYKALLKMNLLRPSFVLSVGDMIEGYSEDTTVVNNQWRSFTSMTGQLNMPFFFIPGNHDYSNPVQEEVWKERFGKSWFHFRYKDALFLFLNTEEGLGGAGKGAIGEDQFNYFREVLSRNDSARWTFVIMHQPLWTQDSTGYWPELEHLLTTRPHTVFAGHEHHYKLEKRNNGTYIMMSVTGGYSHLRGIDEGEFDHVMWVTMGDREPVLVNLLTSGIYGPEMDSPGP